MLKILEDKELVECFAPERLVPIVHDHTLPATELTCDGFILDDEEDEASA